MSRKQNTYEVMLVPQLLFINAQHWFTVIYNSILHEYLVLILQIKKNKWRGKKKNHMMNTNDSDPVCTTWNRAMYVVGMSGLGVVTWHLCFTTKHLSTCSWSERRWTLDSKSLAVMTVRHWSQSEGTSYRSACGIGLYAAGGTWHTHTQKHTCIQTPWASCKSIKGNLL